MDIPFLCPMCNDVPETIIHTLRDYPKAKLFWNSLSPPFLSNLFYGMNLLDWLNLNCMTSKTGQSSNIAWSIIFPFAIWSLWLHCNGTVFGRMPHHKDLKLDVLAKPIEFRYRGMNGKQTHAKTKIQIQWFPPPTN